MKTINELTGKSYFTCSACMSVWADALSWTNANVELVSKTPEDAENIIVLSCQVTDLAILSDFCVAEKLQSKYPNKNIYISGCLSQRTDIELPAGVERLEMMRTNYQPINDKSLVNFEKPFWVNSFKESNDELASGNLFRNKYPLRIGKGCSFNCSYCTIKITRGKHETYDIDERLISEFKKFDDVLLVADSPTVKQINDWCELAITLNKKISIRNVEPQIVIKSSEQLIKLARLGLLDVFHSPIQSASGDVLRDMKRDVESTLQTIILSQYLKTFGVRIATNIIIDYKSFPNEDNCEMRMIYELYDYVSWNPYWDGKWNRKVAEDRFEKYSKLF